MKNPNLFRRLVNRNRSPKCLWPFFDLFMVVMYPNYILKVLIGFFASFWYKKINISLFERPKTQKSIISWFSGLWLSIMFFGIIFLENMFEYIFLKNILWRWGLKMLIFHWWTREKLGYEFHIYQKTWTEMYPKPFWFSRMVP